jgi:hypothetical protein
VADLERVHDFPLGDFIERIVPRKLPFIDDDGDSVLSYTNDGGSVLSYTNDGGSVLSDTSDCNTIAFGRREQLGDAQSSRSASPLSQLSTSRSTSPYSAATEDRTDVREATQAAQPAAPGQGKALRSFPPSSLNQGDSNTSESDGNWASNGDAFDRLVKEKQLDDAYSSHYASSSDQLYIPRSTSPSSAATEDRTDVREATQAAQPAAP